MIKLYAKLLVIENSRVDLYEIAYINFVLNSVMNTINISFYSAVVSREI